MFNEYTFISRMEKVRDGGIFLNHWYELGYKNQNTVYSIKTFRDFDEAYKFFKENNCSYFMEIEVWQYNEKQEIVTLSWNEFEKRFVLE